MKILLFASLAILLISCAPAIDPQAVSSMAVEMAETGVAQTLTALPTNTSLPSPTFTSTPLPTQTQPQPILAATQTANAFIAGTLVNALPSPVSGTEQADKSDTQTFLLLQNNTDQVIWFIIDSPIYLEYRFSDSFGILIGNGDYHYRAYIGSKGPIEGNFHIGNQDKHTITFTAGKVIFQGP